jgi:hypothetical protein
MSTLGSRRPQPCDPMVVSHPCVLPVNQPAHRALRERDWQLALAVPGRWRHEYARTAFRTTALPGMVGSLLPLPVVLAGQVRCRTVERGALAERRRNRIREMYSVDASAEALPHTPTAVVHGSGRPAGGRDG